MAKFAWSSGSIARGYTMAIRCVGECGRDVGDEKDALTAGWSYLSIRGGWRCGTCEGELYRAQQFTGVQGTQFVDQLPADSRGALKKETASTITPPSVKG